MKVHSLAVGERIAFGSVVQPSSCRGAEWRDKEEENSNDTGLLRYDAARRRVKRGGALEPHQGLLEEGVGPLEQGDSEHLAGLDPHQLHEDLDAVLLAGHTRDQAQLCPHELADPRRLRRVEEV